MRVAMISTPFLPTPPRDYGGTELVVSELTEGLLERGHAVTLFATGDSRTAGELHALYERAQWPPDPLVELNHASWALGRIVADGFDVVHAHSASVLPVARLYPHLRVVYTIHHHHERQLSAFYEYHPDVRYVAISADQRRREPGLARCCVIHHGLDPARYAWTDHPRNYVCFIGRFAEAKGAHMAIDAAALAGLSIHVAGQVHPPDREYAQQELSIRLSASNVRYLGAIGMAEKVTVLRDARALLAPITWDEPFGLILIEAMLSGCPVVAFPRGSVPELVEPGVTGVLVRSVEEMASAIAPGGAVDGISRRQCRLRARQRFSRSRFVADYERLYAEAIADGVRRSRPIVAS
jgi:glycosyltransferase involved in cell wall biosynthesis